MPSRHAETLAAVPTVPLWAASNSAAAALRPSEEPRRQPPAGYTFCANEGQTCFVTRPSSCSYGAGGSFNIRILGPGPVDCSNATFGDPDFGIVKACYTKPDTGPPGYTFCANEGQTCFVAHSSSFAFGAGGRFNIRTFGPGPVGLHERDVRQ